MSVPHPAIERLEGGAPETARLLSALHTACFANGWSAESFVSLLGMPGTFALVAGGSPTPAGFIVCRSAADECEIIVVGVLPDLRRRGIARTLVDAAVDALASEGIAVVHLEVAEDNVAARQLYACSGFQETGRRKAYYDVGDGKRTDAIVMSRTIGANVT